MAQGPVQNKPSTAGATDEAPPRQAPRDRPRDGPRRQVRVRAAFGDWFERTFASMRNRNVRVLWFGTALNFAGIMMNMTAQSVVAFDLSGSNRAVGTVMLGQGLSLLVISPFAGAIADRFSKRTMLVACQVVMGVTFFGVGVATGGGREYLVGGVAGWRTLRRRMSVLFARAGAVGVQRLGCLSHWR